MKPRLNDLKLLALIMCLLGAITMLPSCGHEKEAMKESAAARSSAPLDAGHEAAPIERKATDLPSPSQPNGASSRNEPASNAAQPSQASRTGESSTREPQIADCYSIKPEDVPLAPMGEDPGYSPLTNSPGYYPPNDPEADAVRRGRRIAPRVDIPFTDGESSPERLAMTILDGLRNGDSDALQALRVTQREFSDIMWREFPQSRPICNSDAETAYFYLDRECHSGIGLGLSRWGGQDLRLLGITYSIGRALYTNFTLYRGVQIHVILPSGEEGVVRFVRTFAERNGVWKVYAYKDKE